MVQCSRESAEQEAGHGEANPAGGGGGGLFVITDESAAVHEPTEGAFDHPAFGQHVKAGPLGQPFDHLDHPFGVLRLHLGGELRAVEAAVHPQFDGSGNMRWKGKVTLVMEDEQAGVVCSAAVIGLERQETSCNSKCDG